MINGLSKIFAFPYSFPNKRKKDYYADILSSDPFILRTDWTTKQVTINGADVNTSVRFTETPAPQKTGKLQVNSRFRPGADENDKWRSIVMNNGSQSFQFEVNILNGLTVDLPTGTYDVSCTGASILTRITIQQGTTTTVSLVAY